MKKFKLPQPVIQAVNETEFQVVENWQVEFTYKGKRQILRVFKGATTDGASIPRIAWRVIGHPLTGRYLPAALAHDMLYETELMSRADADAVFRLLLKRNGVGIVRRNLMYWAVRIFGGATWIHHSFASKFKARNHVELHEVSAMSAERFLR